MPPTQALHPSAVFRLLGAWLLAAALPLGVAAQGLLGGPAASATVVQSDQARAEIVAHAPDGAGPGQTVWVGLQLTHAPEWHTYWKNAGDSGLPTELRWTLPTGVSAGEIAWPTPRKFPIGNLANYGYDGSVVLPVPLTVGPEFKGDAINVQLYAAWLVCRKECIPEEGNFTLSIPVNGSTGSNGAAFAASFEAAPKDQPAAGSQLQPEDGFLNVSLTDLPAVWRGKTLEFYPETTGLIEPGSPWTQAWDGGRWTARVPLSPHRSESPTQLTVVVAEANPPGQGPGLAGARLDVPVQGAWPAVAPLPAAVPDALQAALDANAARAAAPVSSASSLTLGAALLGALLGGLILNLMPCVFPVLAIKVMAFAKHANDRPAHRANGLAYTAGVVLSFVALGALLLGLRAAGEQLGWGFQLQSPAVVAGLAVLFTLIGLNLAGLFEFGNVLPSRLASLQAKNPTVDAFLTGVLATAIASPCTAPFMGASLGLAIGLPATQALAVFAVLGVGMALPYLAASWIPAVARALPRPGAWMDTFRRGMAFPMFATVVWLLWVLGQQSGIDGAAGLLMLLVVLALLVWSLGLRGRSRAALSVVSLAGLVWLGWAVGPNVTRLQESTPGQAVATSQAGVSWQPWSPETQAALVAEGRPVFVDFTAAWCVTCQYNKRTTLADAAVLGDMAGKNVALLRADWTRRDPDVTAALATLGRNGVPVYAIYKNGQAPQVLSEVLSVEEVRAALSRL
ncbi:protein-disulfide reductase DsbD [Hydrogenophaga sp.]|jgi:thiol:disulfide interchange protein/DsbC/DsbD-like thiol-disulfide interchange protein|uniref:protein-disulfide reductase DsbD family protein n=3 Tax=Hydrogenophaga sp. TaxID=1904254 RepID=UPI0025B93099|nr:thioredoxin family protein [Hydrogenophaga sp.]MDO9506347.1 protein-disulfide reductase DsbD family protein [Hydrogenophaga sp.]